MALPDFSDLIPELICIGIDVAICGILYKVYTVNNGSIRAVKVTFVYVLEKSVRGVKTKSALTSAY